MKNGHLDEVQEDGWEWEYYYEEDEEEEGKYRSCTLKSRSVLRAAPSFLELLYYVYRNISLCIVTIGEKVLTLAKSCGS